MKNAPVLSNYAKDKIHYTPRPHDDFADTKQYNIKEILQLIRRKLWVIIIPLLIIIPIVVWGILHQEPTYKVTTTILIEEINTKAFPINGAFSQDSSLPTELELIKNPSLIEKLIEYTQSNGWGNTSQGGEETLDIDRANAEVNNEAEKELWDIAIEYLSEKFASIKALAASKIAKIMGEENLGVLDDKDVYQYQLVQQFIDSLKIKHVEGTKLVEITLLGMDPDLITYQLNTLVQFYIQSNFAKRLDETKKTVEWLKKESDRLRNNVIASEIALQDFRINNRFVDSDKKNVDVDLKVYDDTSLSYSEARRRRIFLKNQIDQLTGKSLFEIKEEDINNVAEVINTQIMRRLADQYVESRIEHDKLSKIYKKHHPKIITINVRIKNIKQKIVEILRSTYASLLKNESSLKGEVSNIKDDILNNQASTVQFDGLKRELEVNKNLYIDTLKKLREPSLAEAIETGNVKVVRRASVPIFPVPSGKLYKILASIFVGFGLGVSIVFVMEYFDKSFKKGEEVESYLQIPFLGLIPSYTSNTRKSQGPVLLQEPMSLGSEAYRALRTRLRASASGQLKTMLVTSALPSEGKSTTSANMGIAFARLGLSVLLVDIDLRRPSLHHHFRITNSKGLATVLDEGGDWQPYLQDTSVANLKILPTGLIRHSPSDLLSLGLTQRLIDEFKQAFDLIIFDGPIVLSIPDVEIIAPWMDGVVMVHSPARSDRDIVSEATKILERTGAPLLGLLFNNVNQKNFYPIQWPYGYAS